MSASHAWRVFALLGDPVDHSLSPLMQNAAFHALGLPAVYVALRCETADVPVLIRALVPEHRLEVMRTRRGVDADRALCSGPGKLCQALAITREQDGLPLDEAPFELRTRRETPPIAIGPRIGITRAAELPWRYGLAGSPFLSRPLPGKG